MIISRISEVHKYHKGRPVVLCVAPWNSRYMIALFLDSKHIEETEYIQIPTYELTQLIVGFPLINWYSKRPVSLIGEKLKNIDSLDENLMPSTYRAYWGRKELKRGFVGGNEPFTHYPLNVDPLKIPQIADVLKQYRNNKIFIP